MSALTASAAHALRPLLADGVTVQDAKAYLRKIGITLPEHDVKVALIMAKMLPERRP